MLSQEEHTQLRLLLFDPFAAYEQALLETLRDQRLVAHLQCAATSTDFESALAASTWDAVLVDYTAEEALKLAGLVGHKAPVVLICETQAKAESVYRLTTETVADVVTRGQLKRLPFILRRELRRTSLDTPSHTQALADEKIRMLNRTLAVLSDINQAIVRIRDISVLFNEICEIAVEKGTFRLAWIGLLDSKTRRVTPASHAGVPQAYVDKLSVTLEDEIRGPVSAALQSGEPVIINDMQTDPLMQPWREDTSQFAYGAIAALPLMISGEARGIFYLYADQPNFFDDAEFRLVVEMAGDIAFAMEFAEQEAHHKQIESALLASEGRYHRMLDDLLEGAEIIGFDWHYIYVNDASAGHGRLPKEVLLGGTVLDLYPGIENTEMFGHLQTSMQQRIPQHFENEFAFPDGTKTWFELSVQPIPEGIFILSLDITERKRSEIALQRYAKRMEILHELDKGLIQGGSIPELIHVTLRHLRQLIPCQQANVTMIDRAKGEGQIFAHDLNHDSFFTEGVRFSLPADVYEGYDARHIRIFDDIRPLQDSSPRVRQLISEGMVSLLSAMLTDHDNPIGSLVLVSDTEGYFTAEYQEIAAQIASQLTVAIRQLQLSAELHESETRYRRVVEDQTDLICRYRADFTLTFVNQAYAALYDKHPEDLIGMNFFELMPETERADGIAYTKQLGAAKPVTTSEHRSLLPDGSERWIQWTDRALIDADGHITEYQGVGRDITERKQTEELLRKSEARQHAMLTAIPDIMFRYRSDGTFLEYYAPDSDLLAAPPEVFLGKQAHEVLPFELAGPLMQRIKRVVTTKEPVLMEYQLAVKSGIREFESRLVPVADDEVLAIVRDVTERKLAERELQSLYNATSHLFKADSLLGLGRQIVATVVREFEHADCGIMLLDKSKSNILRLARTGESDIRPDMPLHLNGSGLVPQALRTGDVVYVPDVTQNDNYVASEITTLSEFVIPLKTANGIIGALDMQHPEKDAFSERDRRILTAYAERAAPAIEIIQLYEELNRHAADLEWRVAQRTVELNYAKERAEAILNHSIDGIILLDSNMIIEQTNLAFNEIFASGDDVYFEKPFTELLVDGEQERINQIFQAGSIDKKGQHLETRARRKDGTAFDVELGIGFIKKSGLVCIIRDITARKQAEKAIAEERNLLRTLIDALPDYIYVKDTNHKTILSNLARTRSFGFQSPEETIGKDDYAFVPAELVAQYHADEDRLFQTLEPLIDHEELTIGPAGDRIWAATTKVPLHNLNGELIGLVGVTRDISERKIREQQLRFDAGIQASISDAVIATDLEFHIQSWNKAAEAIYGWTADEVIGKTIVEILKTRFDSGEAQNDSRTELFSKGHLQNEFIQQRKDGSELYIQSTSTIYKDEKGVPIGIVGVNRDITEHKKAEQALHEREIRFGLLVNGIRDYAIYLLDTEGNIITWNQGAERIEGYSAQEIIGDNVVRFYTPDDLARGEPARILKIAETEGHFTTEGERIRKDGTRFWAELAVTALKDSTGQLFGFATVTHDLTERRKSQETLRLSEERYRLLAENISDIISRVTPDGVYIDVSTSSKSVLGYAPEEMIGKRGVDFVHPDDIASANHKREESLKRQIELPLSYRFRHRDGHYIWLEVARKFIISPDTNTVKEYVTSARDITVRKRAEEALKNALEKEKELSELKSRFVSMASHEFRTPLATILATSETLSAYRSKLSENQIQEKLRKISDQVTYLKSIIEDTLQVARLQDPKAKFEPVSLDVEAVCRSVIDEFESRTDVTQQFVYNYDSKPHEALLDRKLIRQTINNLLSNAVKYSAPNTIISVTLERVEDALSLKVQDQGIGIPEADLKHLFEPFHRASNVGLISGTGLGLVIAKESVELHGGFISVESKLGIGTTFTIMIPLQ